MTSAAMRLSNDKAQEAVGDGPAEAGGGSGRDGIDMDELMIVGRIGEGGDAVLADLDPVGNADRLADFCVDFVEGGDRASALS